MKYRKVKITMKTNQKVTTSSSESSASEGSEFLDDAIRIIDQPFSGK